MLIIFDFDGVLRNISFEGGFVGFSKVLKYYNINHNKYFTNVASFKKWFLADRNHRLSRLINIKSPKEKKDIQIMFHNYYDDYLYLYDWVPHIIMKISKKHLLNIFSSSTSYSIINSLMSKRLRNRFFYIIGHCEVTNRKPDPEGIYKIKKKI